MNRNTTYWQDNQGFAPHPHYGKPHNSSILIIGSGLAGTSAAYFLKKNKVNDIAIVDCGTENASYFRNAGHILHGASENYKAMCEIHGRNKAKTIFKLSEQFCKEIINTIDTENIDCDLHKGNYYQIASSDKELQDIKDSIKILHEDGFFETYIFRNTYFCNSEARLCNLSSQANPSKFRNSLLNIVTCDNTVLYYCYQIKSIEDINGTILVTYKDNTTSTHDAVIIAANAYNPLISNYFKDKGLIEPFKGQIIVSKPINDNIERFHFSADHGYIYGTITADNRLLIGGWRNNIPGMEIGTYSLKVNPATEKGLKEWIYQNTYFKDLEWEYSWAGIMGSSKTGLPYIGPTNSPIIWTISGCTGYGFGWFHGASKMLVGMMLGNSLPEGYQLFNPNDKL